MGLLDALNSDDARLGLGLLAAGGYSPTPMSVGQRVQMAMQGMDAQAQNKLKTKLMQSQIDENTSQNASRAAQLDKQLQLSKMVQTLFGGGADAQPATSPGAFTPSTDGMGPTMPPSMQAPQAQGGSRLAGMNIDQVAGLKALGGPDLFEAYKWSKDPLQLQQGSTYIDRTTGQSRFMPKVGEGIAPDANGFYAPLPGYAASQGAIEGAKTSATEGAKAGFDLVKVVGPDGAERYVPRSTVLGGSAPGQPTSDAPRPAGRSPMAPMAGESDRFAILSQELERAKASGNAADVASLEREIGRLPASARTDATTSGLATPGFQATPTTAQAIANKAAEARATGTAAADVVRDTARAMDIKTANKFLNIANQVEKVFQAGPTDSGFGSAVDSTAAFFGKATPGSVAAQQLKALGGWLVSNVPRMEGPQSNFDVANYQVMAADVANDKLPLERRMAALKSIKTMMGDVVSGNMNKTPENPGDPVTGKTLKDYGYANEAAAIKDAQNAMMKNPKAKAEIMRRLQSMGISLNTGSF